jgi:hypothetical protein
VLIAGTGAAHEAVHLLVVVDAHRGTLALTLCAGASYEPEIDPGTQRRSMRAPRWCGR